MLKQLRNQFTLQTLHRRRITLLGVAIALLLATAALGVYFVNATATGQSAADARIQGWVNDLNDEKLTASRHLAQQQLEEAGEAAVAPLVAALRSPNATLRRNSAEMLGFIGSPSAIEALSNAAQNDSSPAVRSRAAWALGETTDLRAINTLDRISVLDRNLQVRQAAVGSVNALRANLAQAAGKNERLVRAFAVAPSQPNLVYIAAMSELSVSRDGGKTWTVLAGTTPSRVTALAVSPSNSNVIYAGTESMGLYKSIDGGATWTAINQGLGVEPGVRMSVTAIAIDPSNPDRVYVARGAWVGTSQARILPQGVMLSIDGGASWQALSMPNTTNAITRLVISGNNIYALAQDRVLSQAL